MNVQRRRQDMTSEMSLYQKCSVSCINPLQTAAEIKKEIDRRRLLGEQKGEERRERGGGAESAGGEREG